MSFPLLTDKQILEVFRKHLQGNTIKLTRDSGPYEITELTYQAAALVQGIESATRAPLLAEIERLTAELAASREDAERSVAEERERCSHVCRGIAASYTAEARRLKGEHATHAAGQRDGANECAAAINARGEKAQADTLREGPNARTQPPP